MFQRIKTVPEVGELLDPLLPPGFGVDSLVSCSDRASTATYQIYRIQDEPHNRLVLTRSGGGEEELRLHLAGEKLGGKIGSDALDYDGGKAQLARWLGEWDSIHNPDISFSQNALRRMTVEVRLNLRTKFGSVPIASPDDAYCDLNGLLEENSTNKLARNADPELNGASNRTYAVHRSQNGIIRVGFDFCYGRSSDYTGHDSVLLDQYGTLRHSKSPGIEITEPEGVLDKLNQLLANWLSKKA